LFAGCRYEEREAVSVSEKLSQLDVNEKKDLSRDDDSKPDITSADGELHRENKNKNELLGIDSC